MTKTCIKIFAFLLLFKYTIECLIFCVFNDCWQQALAFRDRMHCDTISNHKAVIIQSEIIECSTWQPMGTPQMVAIFKMAPKHDNPLIYRESRCNYFPFKTCNFVENYFYTCRIRNYWYPIWESIDNICPQHVMLLS